MQEESQPESTPITDPRVQALIDEGYTEETVTAMFAPAKAVAKKPGPKSK